MKKLNRFVTNLPLKCAIGLKTRNLTTAFCFLNCKI